jgi:hypothetical protein
MHAFEKLVVNALSRRYLRWYVLPRFQRLLDAPLRGHGLALGPGVGWEALARASFFRTGESAWTTFWSSKPSASPRRMRGPVGEARVQQVTRKTSRWNSRPGRRM